MKTNFTPVYLRKCFFLLHLILSSFFLQAQPDYKFINPVLVSGTDLAVGAQYRFTNVKTGFDALVTVKSFSGSVTLAVLDDISNGSNEAFQPNINSPAHTDGYVEFEIAFVTTGTSSKVDQPIVAATSLDVDGSNGGGIFEHDGLNLGGGYVDYNTAGTGLKITDDGGGWFSGINISGVGYPGIDTSAKDVMFTVVNTNISTLSVRIGANNTSSSGEVRLRSVYFKKYTYTSSPFSTLPVHLISFQGNMNKNNKVTLNWTVADNEIANYFEIERSFNGRDFTTVGVVFASEKMGTENYTYYETTSGTDKVMYRLKMIDKNHEVDYSRILIFQLKATIANNIKIIGNPVNDKLTFSYTSPATQVIDVKIFDMSGRVVVSNKVNSLEGSNVISLPLSSTFKAGMYVVEVNNGTELQSSKFVKQ